MVSPLPVGFNRIFKTGDLVHIGSKYGQRTLLFNGGTDSHVKVRGQKVDLLAVEAILSNQKDLISRCILLCDNPGKEDQVSSLL